MPLNTKDIYNIKELIKLETEPLKEAIADLKATLPTKKEFYTAMDELMGEIKAVRQEQPVIAHQIRDHEKRIQRLESHQNFPTM